jgi:hypothetical protein
MRIGGERMLVSDAAFVIYAQGVDGCSLAPVEDRDASRKGLLNAYGKLEGTYMSVRSGATYALMQSAAGVSGLMALTLLIDR